MAAYQQGDLGAFAELVARHERRLWNFLRRFVRNPATAEDLLQEVFLRVIKAAPEWQPTAKVTTWMYTIARNLCTDHARRMVSRDAVSLDGSGRHEDSGARPLMDRIPAPGLGTDREAIGKELAARIDVAVAALPLEQREVFLMREVMELETDEICKELTINANNLWVILYRARMALRQCLEQTWFARNGKPA